MPSLDMDNAAVPAVASCASLLEDLLRQAEASKTTNTIEPALNKSDFDDLSGRISRFAATLQNEDGEEASRTDQAKIRQFAMIETAVRDIFSNHIATTTIDSPEFVRMWNLFDILSILSDDGQCDPALLFWLAEELLDSQTISGCRKIFDYLESRRERITANHFKQKQLIILRSCNELLRRLSRAEDTAFCGRVFIFMFQSFPLGDKSSVNLRGEYHLENVTSYEANPANGDNSMDVDSPTVATDPKSNPKGADSKKVEKPLDPDALYPLFWSLQESFSQPKKLFEAPHLAAFKGSLGATMKAFRSIHNDRGSRKPADDSRRDLKRKRDSNEDEDTTNGFNPKYLTSRDLFELEISDLSFRRHILVQALITMDFLLSLTAQAREKLNSSASTNKAVMYLDQTLSEEDAKWASDMKKTIADYLRQGSDGPYFYRMVETVLARDKNWVRWKIEGCHPIKRDPVSPTNFVDAKSTVQRSATNKRLRTTPMGAVPLDFLSEKVDGTAMDRLKAEERYKIPELDDFKDKIKRDDFEIEMPTNDQTKAAAIAGKSSKSWRALRIAARTKLAAFDKIDDSKKIDIVFEELIDTDGLEDTSEPTASDEDMPPNRDTPIIISGPVGVGKSTLIQKLMELHKGVFATVVRHTTREPADGEVNGKTFHFVQAREFNQLRDGDRLIENGTRNDADYGTSTKAIEAVADIGKVPIIELDIEAAQYAKDMDFSARYILIKPPTPEILEQRLKESGKDTAAVEAITKTLSADLDDAKVAELFSTTITNEDQDLAAQALASFIFQKDDEEETGGEEEENEGEDTADENTEMKDDDEPTQEDRDEASEEP
ncbi:THO complex subunit 1 transcription elongation factor-domain-containing protein [Mariannaea sp. PMI_226]|nr:THO complex subunit 1 transcription elongation factor-domain-containing protein [Mariannaea sp. PMI_226]